MTHESRTLVIRNIPATTAARDDAARILREWVAGTPVWAPLADALVEAALCEAIGERMGRPVVLERTYSARHRGAYAGHIVLIDEDAQ